MEEKSGYTVKITPEAELFYVEVLEYFYDHHSEKSANKKSNELIEQAISLENNPSRGRIEELLRFLEKEHRFLLYYYTSRKAIKIIYFINEPAKTVYVTDFFPCEMSERKIRKRSQKR